MKIRVLGAAAGGGFPQWNCNAPLSRAARTQQPGFLPRTQSSIAASSNGRSWAVFNASPDIRQQIAQTTELQPAADGPLRSTPIRAVVLTNADVDHIAGLLTLREKEPFTLYATRRVLDTLSANSIFNVLDPAFVERRELPLEGITELEGPEGPIGLTVESFLVPGKVALFLENTNETGFGTKDGDTVGLAIRDSGTEANAGRTLFYVPGCATVEADLKSRISGGGCLMFDGTVFEDDEMARTGVGSKTGARMGHISMNGPSGSLSALADVELKRRVYIHINNTNPVLDPASREAKIVAEAGWEVAHDGMELEL